MQGRQIGKGVIEPTCCSSPWAGGIFQFKILRCHPFQTLRFIQLVLQGSSWQYVRFDVESPNRVCGLESAWALLCNLSFGRDYKMQEEKCMY